MCLSGLRMCIVCISSRRSVVLCMLLLLECVLIFCLVEFIGWGRRFCVC